VVVDDELTDDAIAGTYRVFQRRRGHRYSLDDVVTAWEAARAQPTATRCLDLGTGIGSVLIMLAYRFPNAELVGIEAQDVSYSLLKRNVARNGLEIRTTLRRGDLRDRGTLEDLPGGPFDLVTGTPPYMDPKDGTLPPDSQKAHARMELRGGVEDYLRAAALVVAPKGRVVMCAGAREPERAIEGGRAAGLLPIRRRDVIPRANEKGPLFFVLTFARAEDHDGSFEHSPPLVARDEGGARTSGAHELRRFFGLEPNEAEPPSP
jgi:tRNA1(Val) A37 N6-methylase TrmN6